jgi:hypothetical protein
MRRCRNGEEAYLYVLCRCITFCDYSGIHMFNILVEPNYGQVVMKQLLDLPEIAGHSVVGYSPHTFMF